MEAFPSEIERGAKKKVSGKFNPNYINVLRLKRIHKFKT